MTSANRVPWWWWWCRACVQAMTGFHVPIAVRVKVGTDSFEEEQAYSCNTQPHMPVHTREPCHHALFDAPATITETFPREQVSIQHPRSASSGAAHPILCQTDETDHSETGTPCPPARRFPNATDHSHRSGRKHSAVRLLVASTSRGATELLGLAAAGVGDQQEPVVRNKLALDLSLRGLVHDCGKCTNGSTSCFINYTRAMQKGQAPADKRLTLLVVGNEGLGDSLPDREHLRRITTTLHADAHVHASKVLLSQQHHGLKHLGAQDSGLQQLDGAAVHAQHTASTLAMAHSHSVTLQNEK